jgi:dipeptidyl aminopeptidase/acylaminoacyl peptidase
MRIFKSAAASAIIALCVGAPTWARDPATPLSVYGRLPYLEDVAISPDGTRLAFVRTTEDNRALFMVEVGAVNVLGGLRVGTTKLRGIFWQDNDTVVAVVSSTSPPPFGFTGATREWYQAVRYTISTHKSHPVDFDLGDKERTFNVLAGEPAVRSLGGKSVLYLPGFLITAGVFPAMFAFDDAGRTKIVARGYEPYTDWLVDEAGNIATQFEYHDEKKTWTIKARREGHMTTVATGSAPIDPPNMLGFDATGEQAIVEFSEGGDPVWRPISLKDGVLGEPLDQGAALHGVITDPRNSRIIGGVLNRDDSQYVFFDNELQAHWNAILRAFPNDVVHLASHSADFSKVVLEVFGPEDGFSYALFDWYSHQRVMLGPRYSGLKETAPVRDIKYRAADGLGISGFLTLPPDLPAKKLPLIVFPHGGPAVRDTRGFDWWAQAMAVQGYAVLQPNYRGSDIDRKFLAAGFGEWGRKMQTDLSDGVHYLEGEGIIDPSRVCIVGASYGGYAALAGVTLQSGIYRCAVSVAGPSDLPRMRSWTKDNQLHMAVRYWDRFWGVAEKDNEGLKAISPVDHVQGVAAPILLIHGRDDTVVPFEQSEVMLKALQRAGKAVQLVTMKHEDHWLSSSETRQQMLEATVAFLRAHNPPD